MSSTAEHNGPSTRRRPRWGRFLRAAIPARKGLVFPIWAASSAHNLAMLPVGCQFKNSSAKRGCALLGNPKVSSASIPQCSVLSHEIAMCNVIVDLEPQ
jgi:hypothetical protein